MVYLKTPGYRKERRAENVYRIQLVLVGRVNEVHVSVQQALLHLNVPPEPQTVPKTRVSQVPGAQAVYILADEYLYRYDRQGGLERARDWSSTRRSSSTEVRRGFRRTCGYTPER